MPRVLILEDEKLVARDLQRILSAAGYETSMAISGEEAIEVAQRDRPELALVDIRLAGKLDGIETAHLLRQKVDLGVVYLTAHADGQTLDRAKATEPCGYLVKPFDENTLRATLETALYKSDVERRNRAEQRRQAAVLDQLTVGLITTDCGGRVKTINARGQSLTGWSDEEAVGKDLARVLALGSGEKDSVTADLLDAALAGHEQQAAPDPLSLVSRSGSATWVEHKVSPLRDENQRIVGAAFVFWPGCPSGWPTAASAPEAGVPDTDPATGLPGRNQAAALMRELHKQQSKHFAALFVLDRHQAIAQKYGAQVADEMLTYYCTFLSQETHEKLRSRGLFRWTGPCCLAILGPLDCLLTAQREVRRYIHVRQEKVFDFGSRMALIPLSASARVFSIDETPPDMMISQLDAFVAIQANSHQY